jgi:hypothetical protein
MRAGLIKQNLKFEKITGVKRATRKFENPIIVLSYGLD